MPAGYLMTNYSVKNSLRGSLSKQSSRVGQYLVCILSFLQQLKIKPSCQASGSGGVSVSAPPSLITCSNNFVPIVPSWDSQHTVANYENQCSPTVSISPEEQGPSLPPHPLHQRGLAPSETFMSHHL